MSRRKRGKRRAARPSSPPLPEPPAWPERMAERAARFAGRRWVPPAALVLVTLPLYARSVAMPLVYYDSMAYVFEDLRIARLSFGNLFRILTEPYFANYHPVTTLTYAVDRALWSTWLPGLHMTQLAFYAGGVVVLYFLFAALLGSRPAAFAAAAVYSAHTLHVESVAWLASRKDVVCLLFYAAAILAYTRYAKRRDAGPDPAEGGQECPWKPYLWALALSPLAMLSKGYAVVLPGAFVAYDLCFTRRFRRRLVADKLPFVVMALAVTVLTVLSQDEASALVREHRFSTSDRLVLLSKVFAVYVGRSILPVRLCAQYLVGRGSMHWSAAVAGVAFAFGAAAGFFALRRRLPAAAFGIALFVMPLATVMNTFFTLQTWMADRYLILPTVGSVLCFAAGGLWLYRTRSLSSDLRRRMVPAAAAAVFALYAVLTVARVGVWTSGVALWSDVVRKQLGFSGSGPVTAGELEGSKQRISSARSSSPSPVFPITLLASAYERMGEEDEAQAIRSVIRQTGLGGGTLEKLEMARRDIKAGRHDEAISRLEALAGGSKWYAPSAWELIGMAHEEKGRIEEARAAYQKSVAALRARGRAAFQSLPLLRLGMLELNAGNLEEAERWFRRAVQEANPADPRPPFLLGLALGKMGRLEEAYELCNEALKLDGRMAPTVNFDLTPAYFEAGVIAERLGRPEEAIRHYRDALRGASNQAQRDTLLEKIKKLGGSPSAP